MLYTPFDENTKPLSSQGITSSAHAFVMIIDTEHGTYLEWREKGNIKNLITYYKSSSYKQED